MGAWGRGGVVGGMATASDGLGQAGMDGGGLVEFGGWTRFTPPDPGRFPCGDVAVEWFIRSFSSCRAETLRLSGRQEAGFSVTSPSFTKLFGTWLQAYSVVYRIFKN